MAPRHGRNVMDTPTVRGIAKKFAPQQRDALNQAVTPGDKPIFRPLAVEGAATLLEEQISALKEISFLLREHLEETRKDRDVWRTQAEGQGSSGNGRCTGHHSDCLSFDSLNTPHSQRPTSSSRDQGGICWWFS